VIGEGGSRVGGWVGVHRWRVCEGNKLCLSLMRAGISRLSSPTCALKAPWEL
jgi:hypothetical protein